MAQRIYFNYQDNDSTFDLNFAQLGIADAGRYRGFDAVLGTGLTLTLNHLTTGVEKVKEDLNAQIYGVWKTKQGGIVSETDAINLPISAGDAILDRIDLIVGRHGYIQVAGGAAAVYSVIEGTPAANPVAPVLSLPNRQVILGQIYIPANTTDLNGAGVVYTQAAAPYFAGNTGVALINQTNTFTAVQNFQNAIQEGYGQAVFVGPDIRLEDGLGNPDNTKNIYFLPTTANPAQDTTIRDIINPPIANSGQVQRVTLIAVDSNFLLEQTGFGRNYYLKYVGAVTIAFDDTGSRYLEEADNAGLGRVNRYWGQQIFAYESSLALFSSGLLNLTNAGNIYNLSNTNSANLLRGLTSSTAFDAGNGSSLGGGVVWVIPNPNEPLNIQHLDLSVPSGYKPIYLPIAQSQGTYQSAQPIMFIETPNYWYAANLTPQFFDVTPSFIVTGGGSISVQSGEIRAKIQGSTLELNISLQIQMTGTVTSFDLDLSTLPYTLRSYNGLPQICAGLYRGPGIASPRNQLYLESNGTTISFRKADGSPLDNSITLPAVISANCNFELDI